MTVDALAVFAAEVGSEGPVVAVGGRTQWDVGGAVDANAREVTAPTGIVEHEPAEMTVRVRAGTTVAELDDALGVHGQCVALPAWPGATVGGIVAVGQSGLRRLGYGPVRDAVLEVRYVSAEGRLVKAGGPTVKNVSGFDLCRLMVGSLGTLGLVGEVILRTRPLPAHSAWCRGGPDPFAIAAALYRPVSVLWDGSSTWVLLEGDPRDVDSQRVAAGLDEVDGPPDLPPHRWSLAARDLRHLGDRRAEFGEFVAEIGVGTVHATKPAPARTLDPAVGGLNARLKATFDPTRRLAPGRSVAA